MEERSGFHFDGRRAAAVACLQIALVMAAAWVSRLDVPPRTSMAIVGALTAVNGLLVAFLLLGVGRSGRLVSLFAIVLVAFLVNLLGWPAWDVYERVRP
jgi:membrane associated rhomboid family serine protease